MLSLEMLDVVIGVFFIYLLLSLIYTAINKFIEAKLKLCVVDLEQGIRELLKLLNDSNGTGLTKDLYNHPLIYSLFRGNYDPAKIRNTGKAKLTSSQGKENDINIDDKKNEGNKNKRYSRGSDLPSYIPLGAPFWFDMLNKVMVVRSTIKPHEKSQEESSKDRQR